jgi:molybdopterin synthase sulfurtransferase
MSPPSPHRPDLRRRQLVTPAWLIGLLRGDAVPHAPACAWRVMEVACDGRAAFCASHVPQAGYVDTLALERGPAWTKVADEELLAVLLHAGIRHDTTVMLYGRNNLAAARAAHLMLYAGVRDVRLLDGGWQAWLAAGGPQEHGEPAAAEAARDFGSDFPANPQYLVDAHHVAGLLRCGSDAVVASIRSWSEHTGRCSGYPYIAARGDIPGARWARAGSDGDVNCMRHYQRADGTMRPPEEIQAFWAEAGIRPELRTAFYCGTGWRASLAFFYAWLMGWERISVFDGGWCAWNLRGVGA